MVEYWRSYWNFKAGSLREKYPHIEFFLVCIFQHLVSLCIQSECRKIRTRKISVLGHFSRIGSLIWNYQHTKLVDNYFYDNCIMKRASLYEKQRISRILLRVFTWHFYCGINRFVNIYSSSVLIWLQWHLLKLKFCLVKLRYFWSRKCLITKQQQEVRWNRVSSEQFKKPQPLLQSLLWITKPE